MKAIRFEAYGSSEVLALKEVERPKVERGKVLVRIHASSMNPLDWRFMRADPFLVRFEFGLLKPKFSSLGTDFSGTVESVAPDVTGFQPGNEVFGTLFPDRFGAFAEYVSVSEHAIILKPASISHAEASTLGIAALTAYQGINDYRAIAPGDRVLINGASGGVGTFAVQFAKVRGAQVTAVCSGRNLNLVRRIGADEVIDYEAEDFTRLGERYDLILDAIGNHAPSHMKKLIRKGGRLVYASATSLGRFARIIATMATDRNRVALITKLENGTSRLHAVLGLCEEAGLKPVIDRVYSLEETRTAIDYVASKRARGKVIIQVLN